MMREEEERKGFVHWGKGQSRTAALLVGTALMFNILTHSTQTHASSLWSKGVWLECTFTRFLTYPLKFNQSERLCSPKLHFSSVFNTVCCQMTFKFALVFLPHIHFSWVDIVIMNTQSSLTQWGLHACSTLCPQREDSLPLVLFLQFWWTLLFFLNKVIIMYSTERTQVV